jgi:hypothetical protein
MLSHRIEREMEYLAKTTLPLNPISIIHSLPLFRIALQFGIIFTPILFTKGGESLKKGLYFTHKYPFLAIHAKGGESISPKQKDRTTINFKHIVFQIWVKKRFFNWYIIFDIILNWYTLFKINI